jgi:hypothetical protein
MDMQYRILWFDDQPGGLSTLQQVIQAKLNPFGFTLNIRWIESFDDKTILSILDQLRTHNPYDLIMVDYDLGQGSGGEHLLKKLRFVSSGDMVFYSGASVQTLREKLLKQAVDGIFCLDRTKLNTEVFSIVKNTLRRIMHPNYMRGLVVGSVAEMDVLFSEIILAMLTHPDMPTEEEIKSQIKRNTEIYLSEQQNNLKNFEEKKLKSIIKKENLHTKINLLLDLLQKEGSRTAHDYCDELEKFLSEVNQHRIEFAHACTEENDEGIPIFKERNGKIWKPEEMQQLLLKIRKHKLAAEIAHQHFVEE